MHFPPPCLGLLFSPLLAVAACSSGSAPSHTTRLLYDRMSVRLAPDVAAGRVAAVRKANQPPDIIDILRNLLLVCFRSHASDIHIEPKNEDYQIRTRVDGNMVEVLRLAKEFGTKLTAVVKILCDIDARFWH